MNIPKSTKEDISVVSMFMGLPLAMISPENRIRGKFSRLYPLVWRSPLLIASLGVMYPYINREGKKPSFPSSAIYYYYGFASVSAIVEGVFVSTKMDRECGWLTGVNDKIGTGLRRFNISIHSLPWIMGAYMVGIFR